MGKISKETRELVYKKSGGKCWYCGKKLGSIFDVDHFVAKHNGGIDDFSNLVPSCSTCNRVKKHRTLENFRNYYHKKAGMVFTKEQKEFLNLFGIEVPKPIKHIFYFEEMGLSVDG